MELELEIVGEHLFTADEKIEWWGYGEWVEEPDIVQFTHEGLVCECLREFTVNRKPYVGHWCGYVYFECFPSWSSQIIVYGGVTFNKKCEENSYSIGFDCGHQHYDFCPGFEMYRRIHLSNQNKFNIINFPFEEKSPFKSTYKNLEFVIKHTKFMADQVSILIKKSSDGKV